MVAPDSVDGVLVRFIGEDGVQEWLGAVLRRLRFLVRVPDHHGPVVTTGQYVPTRTETQRTMRSCNSPHTQTLL